MNRLLPASLLAGSLLSTGAAVSVLTDPGDIAAFKTGATVENFDDLPGLVATDYTTPLDATGFTFSFRSAATPTYDSGGATATDPANKPGLPVAVIKPSGGIAGDVGSAGNVITPLFPDFDPAAIPTALKAGSFMEIALPKNQDAVKIGFLVTHGSVQVQIQDDTLQQLEIQQVSAGEFITFTRNSADIRNVSLTTVPGIGGVFTIDDFTYGLTATDNGNGNTTTPDGGATLSMALSAIGFGFAKWKLRRS